MKIIFSLVLILTIEMLRGQSIYLSPYSDSISSWPEFPGGRVEMMRFIYKNVHYPIKAYEQGISGRVIVGFTISEKGTIEDVRILKSVEASLDGEALRVVEKMPKWKPGYSQGVAVKVKHKVDIVYKLPPGPYISRIACDSNLITSGTFPQYGDGKTDAFQRAAKEILGYYNSSTPQVAAGNVSITFTINQYNELTDIEVLKSSSPIIEEDALNVIRKLRGSWKSGTKNGKPIEVKYIVDFVF